MSRMVELDDRPVVRLARERPDGATSKRERNVALEVGS